MYYRKMKSPIGELLLVGTQDVLEMIGFPEGKGVVQVQAGWQSEASAFADAVQQLNLHGTCMFDFPISRIGRDRPS